MSRARLRPGETTIDRATPEPKRNNPKKIVLRFSITHYDGRRQRATVEAPARTPIADLRRLAHEKADHLLNESTGTWGSNSPMSKYLTDVTAPLIDRSTKLQERSKRRYHNALDHLTHHLRGYSIRDAATFGVLERTILDIASGSGRGSAVTAKTVLGKYVLPRLVAQRIIDYNPLAGVDIDIPYPADFTPKSQRLHTLTYQQWELALTALLERDTTVPLYEDAINVKKSTIAKHDRVVALTILQMTTGLRIAEACAVQWCDVHETDNDLIIDLPASKAKGKRRGRAIPVLHDGAVSYLSARREDPDRYVVGAPTNTALRWNTNNADDDIPELYRQLTVETGIPTLSAMRSHDWRATLNGIYSPILGTQIASAIFGHSQAINQSHYTDNLNVESRVEGAKVILSNIHGRQ